MIDDTTLYRAIVEARGNVTAVAETFGVSKGTIYNRINTDAKLQNTLAGFREKKNAPIDGIRSVRKDRVHSRGCVYLIKEAWRGYIKVGVTKNLRQRVYNIQCSCPQEISLLGYIEHPDSFALEQQLHEKFKNKHVSGEWFELSDEDIKDILGFSY